MAAEIFSLRDLAAALDRVSDGIKRELSDRAQTHADQIVTRAKAAYPVGPVHWRKGRLVGGGTLRASVGRGTPRAISVTASGVPIPAAVARVLAPHVHFYERGAGLETRREDPTRRNPITGRAAYRGVAPPHGRIFVDLVIEERTALFREAEAIINRPQEL